MLHATWLNEQFELTGSERRAFAVEPGLVRTRIQRESSPLVNSLTYTLLAPLLKSAEQGAATQLFCLMAPAAIGGYYSDCALAAPLSRCADRKEAQRVQRVFESLWGDELLRTPTEALSM